MFLLTNGILFFLLLGPAVVGCAAAQPSSAGELSPNGRWLTESGNLEVGVAPCGPALCGTVTRVVANNAMSPSGQSADGAATQPVLGMVILKDFEPSGDGEWKGQIFNRENGQTYSCIMTVAAADTLKIRPYKGIPLFGKTQLWHRVGDQTAHQ